MKKILSFFIIASVFLVAGAFVLKKGPALSPSKGPKQKIAQGDVFFAVDDYGAALPSKQTRWIHRTRT